MVWEKEGNTAKLLMMTFAYRATCFLLYGADVSKSGSLN
jgi:hypothetical protein